MRFRWAALLVSAFLLAAPSAVLADDGADTTLVKRYDGSLIVSYETFDHTDFTAPRK